MSGLATLFTGAKTPKVKAAPPPAPRIGDAAQESAGRASITRIRKRMGTEDTILTSSLGNAAVGNVYRSTLGG